jgi:hypothetical protein
MASTIILNKSNITNLDRGNNRLEYSFPRSVEFNEGDEVALSNLNIYYSWFNISEANNNNFFQYTWFNNTNGDVTDIHDVIIDDGYYSVNTLYEYFQKVMVSNGHYLEMKNGSNYLYFIEILTNSTYYSVELKLSSVSTTYDFGGSEPEPITDYVKNPTTWAIPSTFKSPSIIIPSNNKFGELLGFMSGTVQIPPEYDIQYQYSTLNNIVPNMEVSSSFYVTCSLVDNEFSTPNNVLFSFSLGTQPFGTMLSPITELIYSKIKPGIYNKIVIEIYDQDFNKLNVIDPNMLISLSIKQAKKKEE